ncbi:MULTISPECIES: ASCH domain-containing protein [unclassified Desulfovibrio]|uniref:ASCH domain-containing protein n=1 Tax=unclassified Desulfovibrio TaxID=2593640 RepID=UPI0013EE25C5|nr:MULTISPECIES: ASCH domain-containing protein [unclassified Desulfovibrio]
MNRFDSPVLISVKPHFSQLIADGKKTVELRKKIPANLIGRMVYIYSTRPDAKIIGFFEVKAVEYLPIEDLWLRVRAVACMNENDFFSYYSKKTTGYAIFFQEFVSLKKPISLCTLRKRKPGFIPPQNYHYINPDELLKGESPKLSL